MTPFAIFGLLRTGSGLVAALEQHDNVVPRSATLSPRLKGGYSLRCEESEHTF